MATVQKTFSFLNDAEGLVDMASSASVVFSHHSSDGNPLGCVQFTQTAKNAIEVEGAQQGISQSWETWGVPFGATVNTVRVVSAKYKIAGNTKLDAHEWRIYVVDVNGAHVTDSGARLLDAILPTTLSGWVDATGMIAAQTVKADRQAYNSVVRLTIGYTVDTGTGGGSAAVDARFDEIVLEIDYTESGPEPITLTPAAVATPLGVTVPSLGFGALALEPVSVASGTFVPLSSVAVLDPAITLEPTPVGSALFVPGPSLSMGSLTLSPAPVGSAMAVPSPTLGLGALTLSPTPVVVPLVQVAPSLTMGALSLSPSAVILNLTLTEAVLDSTIVLSPDAVAVSLDSPSPVLVLGALDLSPLPLSVLTETLTPGLGMVLSLAPQPVAAGTGVVAPSLSLGALSLLPLPIAVQLGLTQPRGSVGPLVIVTGSKVDLVKEMLDYWVAYDAAGSEAERGALLRKWLLEHGGRVVRRDGFRVIEGGLFPVRVEV